MYTSAHARVGEREREGSDASGSQTLGQGHNRVYASRRLPTVYKFPFVQVPPGAAVGSVVFVAAT